MSETEMLQPTDEVGVYLHKHKHQWDESGANLWPVGSWHPVFTCTRCGDVICDLSQTVGPEPTKLVDMSEDLEAAASDLARLFR